MKKSTLIEIAGFVIPAILAFSSYSYGEMGSRIGYAIAIGIVFGLPISSISTGAKPEYRKKASTSEKINLLFMIVGFPILYIMVSDYYDHADRYEGKAMIAWCSLMIALAATFAIGKAIEFVIKLFNKE